jgi:hypothetical protein
MRKLIFKNCFLPFAALAVLLFACEPERNFPPEPAITFKSFSKDSIAEFDTATLSITFQDGDGDIGQDNIQPSCPPQNICDLTSDSSCLNDPAFTLFLMDLRDSCLQLFNIPRVDPSGRDNALEGEIRVVIPPVTCKCFPDPPGCAIDTLYYDVFIRDRAGNWSNTVRSDTVYVYCN